MVDRKYHEYLDSHDYDAQVQRAYRSGYKQGVEDMAKRLTTYYTTLPLPKVQPTVVEYNIRVLAEELLEKEE